MKDTPLNLVRYFHAGIVNNDTDGMLIAIHINHHASNDRNTCHFSHKSKHNYNLGIRVR